jgi:iron(III) transport system substrate-binding protein
MKRGAWLLPILLWVGCSSREVVVVYSPHGMDVLGDYKRLFEAAYPEVELRCLDMGAQEIYAKVSAERGRPAADVWWGAPATMFRQAAREGLLEGYRPSWADAAAPEHRDPEDRWYATHLSPLAIMFNTRRYQKDELPQSWDDLLDPRWKGQIALRRPMPSGTMRTFFCAMIARAPDEDAGFAWLKQLHEATVSYPESPNLLYDHLKKRENLISVWIQPDIVMQRERNGFPFDFHLPPGTPVLTEGIAIVKNAPHPERARQFYEFVTTREALAQQARDYAKWPARRDVDPESLPEWMRTISLDAMPIDWDELSARERDWCRRWEEEVYSSK